MPSIVFVGELVIVERIDDSIERCGAFGVLPKRRMQKLYEVESDWVTGHCMDVDVDLCKNQYPVFDLVV
jgi:hypothetical protein